MRLLHASSDTVAFYRRDIDGLRAIAVLAVLLFHAFPTLLPGGFAGVDIFFVISGYLITGILLRNLGRGDLQLFDFYRHRVRRIFPALICVLLACMAAGWLVLFASEYSQLGWHVAASTVFASNFSLWNEAGYFDVAAETKPLLHLWSLAVEEQFYVLWPPLLWLAWKLRIAPVWLAASCVCISFVICVWLSTHDPTADFFSPAARFWEILVGAALTCGEMKRRRAPLGIYRAGLSLTGGIVLAISLVLLHGSDPYPGWRAAMPVLGAALMLAAGQAGLLNRWLLASTPLVWVGLISYPLYLWHWPLLAFARILVGNEPTWQLRASCLAVSMVLAVLTYAVIERPLRFGTHGSKKMAALCATLLLVGGAGLKDWQHNGLLHRYITMHTPPSGLAALLRTSPFVRNCTLDAPHPVAGWCYTDTREPPRYAVLGDSRGEALFWSLVRTSEPHGRWMIAARPGCTPMSDMQRVTHNDAPKLAADDPDLCAAFNAAAINHVLHSDTIRLVLISTARRVLEDEGYAPRPGAPLVANGAFDGLSALVTQLQRAGKAVIFQQDNPALGNSSDCIPRVTGLRAMDRWLLRLRGATCNLDYDSYMSSIRPYLAHIAALKLAHPEMIVFDPTPILCNISEKNCPMVNDGEFLYSYGDHISTYAGDRIATALMPVLGLPLAPM